MTKEEVADNLLNRDKMVDVIRYLAELVGDGKYLSIDEVVDLKNRGNIICDLVVEFGNYRLNEKSDYKLVNEIIESFSLSKHCVTNNGLLVLICAISDYLL